MIRPADLDALHDALRDASEVTGRELMRIMDDGCRSVPVYRPVGAAAFDTDPDYVPNGTVLAGDMSADSDQGRRLSMLMAVAVRRLVAERGLTVEYRLGERWHPVRPDSDPSGPGGGYGIAADHYHYRLRGPS